MNYETISGKTNPNIKRAVRLRDSAAARRKYGLFVVEGSRLCLDATRCGFSPETLLFTGEFLRRHPDAAEEISLNAGKSFLISDAVAEKLADTVSPQGVFCVFAIPEAAENGMRGRYIGLENIADPANLGAVARTAEALGIAGIICFGRGCDPFSPKAQRAAMGALLRLPVYTYGDVAEFKAKFPEVKVYAAVTRGGSDPADADFSSPCVVIIGNEANGLSTGSLTETIGLTLPMTGKAESLNAAAASAIFMWEMAKYR